MSSRPAQPARDPHPDEGAVLRGNHPKLNADPAYGPQPDALEAHWLAMQTAVRRLVQPGQFETWFRRAALVHADGEVLRIALQDNFSRGWLETYYREALERAAHEVFGSARRIELLVDPEAVARPMPLAALDAGASSASISARAPLAPNDVDEATRQGLLMSSDLGLNPKYTFDNFVVGPCNRFAWAAAAGTAEAPGKAYNPFFLHGSVGLGKTHLLQSLCVSLLERNPKTRILYLSCETFVNHFIGALEDGDVQKFRNKYRNVDVLVVDDGGWLVRQRQFPHLRRGRCCRLRSRW
jgi:chromosomal replication initiator protein